MLYNEEYILSRIRGMDQQIALLASAIGGMTVILSSAFTQVSSGDTDPVNPPKDATKAALYYNTVSGVLFQWIVATQLWK